MPANPNNHPMPHWDAPPTFCASHDVQNLDHGFTPESAQELSDYLMQAGLPEIDVYDGFPDIQRDIAESLGELLYKPGADLSAVRERYTGLGREGSNELTPEVCVDAVFHAAQTRKKNGGGTCTVVTLRENPNGTSELVVSEIARTRSFG